MILKKWWCTYKSMIKGMIFFILQARDLFQDALSWQTSLLLLKLIAQNNKEQYCSIVLKWYLQIGAKTVQVPDTCIFSSITALLFSWCSVCSNHLFIYPDLLFFFFFFYLHATVSSTASICKYVQLCFLKITVWTQVCMNNWWSGVVWCLCGCSKPFKGTVDICSV